MSRNVSLAQLGPDAQRQVVEQIRRRAVEIDAARAKLSEKELHKAVAAYFNCFLPNTVIWFHYKANELTKRSGGIWKARGVKAGIPDFYLTWRDTRDRTLYIELKSARGRVSPTQANMHSRLEAIGHSVEVARSLDEVEAILEHYCVPVRKIAA